MKTKILMKYQLPELPEENVGEIRDIVRFIRKNAHPDLIILFGKYAGGKMQSVLGGYEFLLVSPKGEPFDAANLNRLLERNYLPLERKEPNIFLHTYNMNYINNHGRRSYFFYTIRNEGIVLYDNGLCGNIFSGQAFQATQATDAASSRFDLYFRQGTEFFNQAQQDWDKELPRMAALHLHYAADCLFRTIESIFYGSIIRDGNMKLCYMRTRHFSQRLAATFDITFYENRDLLEDLDKYGTKSLDDQTFNLSKKNYNRAIAKIKALQEIVSTTCREHIRFLEKCAHREISITPPKPPKTSASEKVEVVPAMQENEITEMPANDE